MTDEAPTCAGCYRANPTPAGVCEGCRQRAADQLAALPKLHEKLILAQIPGSTVGGRPGGKRVDAPLPVRVDPLSLLAAGTFDVDADELVEQTGSLPLALWLNAWAGDWVERHYPITRPREIPVGGWPGRPGDPALMRQLLTGAGKLVVGYEVDGRPIRRPISDTLEAEYAARYGRADADVIARTVRYLANRLDAACDRHEQIADFLGGLRVLYGACQAAVGEHSDLHHLGRCPERRLDHETGEQVLCGAALWTDPYVTAITCPRCRTETKERDWLALGRRIRAAWPDPDAATQPGDPVAHEMLAELVKIPPKTNKFGDIITPGRQYWTVGCTCGGLVAEVIGKRADVRGMWVRHRDYRLLIADVEDEWLLVREWLRVNGADPDEVLDGSPIHIGKGQVSVRYVERAVDRTPLRGVGGQILTRPRTFTITNPWPAGLVRP
jgi:hypothetical protein